MILQIVQKDILDNYFAQLRNYGYINPLKAKQAVFAVLLLDAINMLGDFLTADFKYDVDVIMRRLNCCNCAISWSKATLAQPFFVMGQWNTGVPSHTHIISEIIGLQSCLDELTDEIKRVDAKANAGL